MAFNFPDSPTVGLVYSGYVWDGEKWLIQGASVPEAPLGNLVYGRANNAGTGAWQRAVALTGDNMTGALQMLPSPKATPNAATMNTGSIGLGGFVGFNMWVDTVSVQRTLSGPQYSARIYANAGDIMFDASTASNATDAVISWTGLATLSKLGVLTTNAITLTGGPLSLPTGSVSAPALNFGTANTGVHGTSAGVYWTVGGANKLAAVSAGTASVNVYSTTGMDTLNVAFAPVNFHGISTQGNTGGSGLKSIISSFYGMVGANVSSTSYSFYGTIGAFLSSGTWATSDGGLKSVTRNVDPSVALAAVNAIAVKAYQPVSAHARAVLYGDFPDQPEEMYGWIAQEVEAIIPIAVRDIGIPHDDKLMREAAGGVDSIKAINDRYMLTTLWSAVQRLSQQNDELRAALDALAAPPP